MAKASSSRKPRSGTRAKPGGRKNPSIAKPLALLAVAVVVALGGGFLLAATHRRAGGLRTTPKLPQHPLPDQSGRWSKGNSRAKAILVEFVDFQCGACAAASSRMANIARKHGSRLKIVFKHYPMQKAHSNAMIAAQAAEAAGRQYKFWEMHDLLLQRQRDWPTFRMPRPSFSVTPPNCSSTWHAFGKTSGIRR